MDEIHLLALAKEEMKGRPLWTYAKGYDHDEGMLPKKEDVARLGGAKFTCFYDEQSQKNEIKLMSRLKDEGSLKVEQDLVDFVVGLQDAVSEHINYVVLRTTHYRNGMIF